MKKGKLVIKTVKDAQELIQASVDFTELSITELAVLAGCCYQTASRMYHKDTKFPRFQTVTNMLLVFGYKIEFRRKKKITLITVSR